MERRFPGGIPEDRQKQAEYEMDVIIQMGFPGYFLVVADFIMWAKNQGIAVGPGRGSAAGSIVAYAMGITDLDPIPHGLLFERFLNPERVSMPDVDIDFDTEDGVPVGIEDITPNVRMNAEFPKPASKDEAATKYRKLSGVVTEFSNRGGDPAVRRPAGREREPPPARGAVRGAPWSVARRSHAMLSLGNAFAEMVDEDMVVDDVRVRERTSLAAYAAVPRPRGFDEASPSGTSNRAAGDHLHSNDKFGG